MSTYKINVVGLWVAEVEKDTDTELTFKKVEKIAEMQEIQVSPKIAEGHLYGDGRKVHATNKKTSYEMSVDMTALPQKFKSYIEGTTINTGVESGTSKDQPRAFAVGFKVEKTENKSQCIWFPYCKAKPTEESVKQSEENLNYSTDKLTITALEHKAVNRFYTKIDEDNADVTSEMVENFFTKVQTTDTIEKGV